MYACACVVVTCSVVTLALALTLDPRPSTLTLTLALDPQPSARPWLLKELRLLLLCGRLGNEPDCQLLEGGHSGGRAIGRHQLHRPCEQGM
jgi:hypothetical protein